MQSLIDMAMSSHSWHSFVMNLYKKRRKRSRQNGYKRFKACDLIILLILCIYQLFFYSFLPFKSNHNACIFLLKYTTSNANEEAEKTLFLNDTCKDDRGA